MVLLWYHRLRWMVLLKYPRLCSISAPTNVFLPSRIIRYIYQISVLPVSQVDVSWMRMVTVWQPRLCTLKTMMKSSNGNIFRVTALCAGTLPVTGEYPSQRPVTRNCDVFFHLRLNKQLSKQSRCRWFETKLRSLWRFCNDTHLWVPV